MEAAKKRLGILVVHGIGGPAPGETLTNLADALEVEGYITYRGELLDERRRCPPDPDQAGTLLEERLVRGGPLPVQLAYGYPLEGDDAEVLPPIVLAEAFWADITRLPGGIVGVLRGYFDIFFNMIILIRTAAPSVSSYLRKMVARTEDTELFRKMESIRGARPAAFRRPFAGLVSWMSITTTRIISGPVAAANLFLMVLSLILLLSAPFLLFGPELVERDPAVTPLNRVTSVVASAITIALLAIIAVAVNCKLRCRKAKPYRLGAPPELLMAFCHWLFVIAVLACGELLASWCFQYPQGAAAIQFAAFHLPWYLVIVLGGLLLPLLVILLSLTYLARVLFFDQPDLEIICLAPLLQAALWMILLPEFWRILIAVYPASLTPEICALVPSLMASEPDAGAACGYAGSYFEWEGLQAFTMLVFFLVAVMFFIARTLGLRKACVAPGNLYRAILNKPVSAVLSLLMIFAGVQVLGSTLHVLNLAAEALPLPDELAALMPLSDGLHAAITGLAAYVDVQVLGESLKKALTAMKDWLLGFEILKASPIVIAVMMSFGLESLRQAMSLADEIISYLQYNGAAARKREFEVYAKIRGSGGGEALNDILAEIDRRRPIRRCFNQALNCLLKDYDVTHLLIISHSQGTVIALDELNEDSQNYPKRLHNRGADVDVTWVTMGSPIAHLYQYYFPSCYPAFHEGKRNTDGSVCVASYWNNLVMRVDRWVNLYRADDFVGTTMGLGDEMVLRRRVDNTDDPLVFREQCVGHGGHGNYWSDTEVLNVLGKLLCHHGYGNNRRNPVEVWKELEPRSVEHLARS